MIAENPEFWAECGVFLFQWWCSAQSEPSRAALAQAQNNDFAPELTEEFVAEHPEYLSIISAIRSWFSQTEKATLAQNVDLTPELVDEMIAENPEFWAECGVFLFQWWCSAQSEPSIAAMAQAHNSEFTPDLAEEFVAENPEFWNAFISLFKVNEYPFRV